MRRNRFFNFAGINKMSALFLILPLCPLAMTAQNKIDMAGRMVIDAARDQQIGSRTPLQLVTLPVEVTPESRFTVIVTLDGNSDLLSNEGVEVLASRGDMAIVSVTAAQMEQLAALPAVKQLSMGNEVRQMMNRARVTTNVDQVQAGTGGFGGVKYTGKGVVAGLMDQGLDVNHINFLDADGLPRTKALWRFSSGGAINEYLTPLDIAGFESDMKNETHGTHVLGIMAGSYQKAAEYVVMNGVSVQSKKQNAARSLMPYYGIATDAELAVSCGVFAGSNVELGMEKVVEYAKAEGKPCVVNLSVGNTYGPHDGTDASSRWLASLGEDAVICVAAGNDGDAPVSLSKTFSASSTSLKTFIGVPKTGVNGGLIDIWGADASLYTVKFIAYNVETGETVFSYPIDKNLEGKTIQLTGNYYSAPGYVHDDDFDAAFGEKAVVFMSSNIDPANNRYNVMLSNVQIPSGGAANIAPAVVIEGKNGQTIDCYANGDSYLYSLGVNGFTDGNSDCSINGLACGDNIIVVGSYTNVSKWPSLDMKLYHYAGNDVEGEISSFSSYGTTFTGRKLPDVCAPGGAVVSSYSKFYYTSQKLGTDELSGIYTGAKRNSYWGVLQGTSMACPVVSGIVATWLEADPTLTVGDVKEIIKRSAIHDQFTAVDPIRWGSGKIDALAGLKDILGISGISDVTTDVADVVVTSADNRKFEIHVPGARGIEVQVYSVSGACVAEASADGDVAEVSVNNGRAGVYVLKVSDRKDVFTRKIFVK